MLCLLRKDVKYTAKPHLYFMNVALNSINIGYFFIEKYLKSNA